MLPCQINVIPFLETLTKLISTNPLHGFILYMQHEPLREKKKFYLSNKYLNYYFLFVLFYQQVVSPSDTELYPLRVGTLNVR